MHTSQIEGGISLVRIPIEVLAARISVWLFNTTTKRLEISPRITFGMYKDTG